MTIAPTTSSTSTSQYLRVFAQDLNLGAYAPGPSSGGRGVPDALTAGQFPRSVGVEQLECRSHRLERGQRPWPEQDLDLREAPGAELPEFVGNLLG
jgi:hypothetical protein